MEKENTNLSLPFKETKISDNSYLREFKQETNSNEFVWHRDREDRVIESVYETDWSIQIDNELPMRINGKIEIPMSKYHRLIKGNGDLTIKVVKN